MKFINPITREEITDMSERGVMVQCDDCAGTGIIGDEGPGMKNAVHEWLPCPCKEVPQITESQVIDWLLSQHIALRNISRTDYSAITLTSNGHSLNDIGLTVNIYDGASHIQGGGMQDALDKLRLAHNTRLDAVNKQLAILLAEKEQLEAVASSKQITDKMQEVAA